MLFTLMRKDWDLTLQFTEAALYDDGQTEILGGNHCHRVIGDMYLEGALLEVDCRRFATVYANLSSDDSAFLSKELNVNSSVQKGVHAMDLLFNVRDLIKAGTLITSHPKFRHSVAVRWGIDPKHKDSMPCFVCLLCQQRYVALLVHLPSPAYTFWIWNFLKTCSVFGFLCLKS